MENRVPFVIQRAIQWMPEKGKSMTVIIQCLVMPAIRQAGHDAGEVMTQAKKCHICP